MTQVVSVKFKDSGKPYYFDPKGEQLKIGENVIVDTARGLVFGEVTQENTLVEDETVIKPLREVIRRATPEDVKRNDDNRRKEKEALAVCEKRVLAHKLDMKLVDVEYAFDGSKMLFYFTSDGRVDFRELVRDLASTFRTRIELRQIGVRDEAKLLGGIGICGQEFCCTRFLNDFYPVSIRMAKDQGLSLNPTKISGCCGRLMCCLNYEQNVYDELIKVTPRVGAQVNTPQGVGHVIAVSMLEQKVKVKYEDNDTPVIFDCCDVQAMRKPCQNKQPQQQPKAQKPAKPRPPRQRKPRPDGEKGEKPAEGEDKDE